MKSNHKHLELVGMVIVLLSVGWQVFIEVPMARLEGDASSYRLNKKLDDLFSLQAELHSNLLPDAGKSFYSGNRDLVLDRWTWAGDVSESPISTQRKWATRITGILFIFGSVLIVFGKYVEIQSAELRWAAVNTSPPDVERIEL